MCYSAQIVADYRKYVKMFGPDIDIREFARLLDSVNQNVRFTDNHLGRSAR